MKQWFREHLPFKILKTFPDLDTDNKFKGIGLNIWYDDRNSRVFLTKRDYIVKNKECLKYDEQIGIYEDCSTTKLTCPDGYILNEITQMCEKTTMVEATCVERKLFNFWRAAKTTCDSDFTLFYEKTKLEVKCAYMIPIDLSCGGSVHAGSVFYINDDIEVGSELFLNADSINPASYISGNYVADTIFIPDTTLAPGIPPLTRVVITIVNGVVTEITNFNSLPDC